MSRNVQFIYKYCYQYVSCDLKKHLLGLQLQYLFKYAELTEVVTQNGKLFIDLVNKVRVGNIDNHVEILRKTRFLN